MDISVGVRVSKCTCQAGSYGPSYGQNPRVATHRCWWGSVVGFVILVSGVSYIVGEILLGVHVFVGIDAQIRNAL